jgi:hypothetical protein
MVNVVGVRYVLPLVNGRRQQGRTHFVEGRFETVRVTSPASDYSLEWLRTIVSE